MYDLLITNGTIVTGHGTYPADIAVKDGIIAAIGNFSSGQNAARIVNARGLHILPGLIDDHVHFREPGSTHKEDFGTGTRAAAAGGVTTIFDMPNNNPAVTTVAAFQNKMDLIRSKAYVDFGIYAAIIPENLNDLEDLASAGIIGFKLYMGETTGNIQFPNDGELYQAFQTIRKTGLRVGAHAENDAILQVMKSAAMASGRTDARAHLDARPAAAEAEAVSRFLILSQAAGNDAHIFHISSREGLEQAVEARRRGLPVTIEVLVSHLLLSDSDYERLGNQVKMNPPVRSKEHQQALWNGLQQDWIDNIATDHAPHLPEEKMEPNVWKAPGGVTGVETALPLMLTEVNNGRLSLEHYVHLTSENPARIWRIYPKKGVIQVGSDADLVLVDLARKDTIQGKRLHIKHKFTPFEGWPVQGIPVSTILRGHTIMVDNEVIDPPHGELVKPL